MNILNEITQENCDTINLYIEDRDVCNINVSWFNSVPYTSLSIKFGDYTHFCYVPVKYIIEDVIGCYDPVKVESYSKTKTVYFNASEGCNEG